MRQRCQDVAAIPLRPSTALAKGLLGLARGKSLTESYYADERMWQTLRRWSSSVGFDAVVVFSSGMAPYGLGVEAPCRVIDFCDWDSRKWSAYAEESGWLKSRLLQVEASRLEKQEKEWIRAFDRSIIITEAEADEVVEAELRQRLSVVGNGVEVRPSQGMPGNNRVGFLGAMDYRPNIDAVSWFAETAWPAIQERVPEATFQIVGRNPSSVVSALGNNSGIEVTGEVPDAGAYIDGFSVAVAPLRIARGLQNKVLEAMAAGRSVVLTSKAAEGIVATDGCDYRIADDPQSIADAITWLLSNPAEAEEMGQNARKLVESQFNWDREMSKFETLLGQESNWESMPIRRPMLATV